MIHTKDIEKDREKKHSRYGHLFSGVSLAVICFVLLFAGIGVASATTYYVRIDGNDSCSGHQNVSYSENPTDCAWRTITHALATITAGDTVRVQSGTYNEEPELTHSGTEAQPINIIGDGNPILDGEGTKENGFYLTQYCTLSGFTVQNYTGYGVKVISYGDKHGISITNCTFKNITQWGIRFRSIGEPTTLYYENIHVENNTFYNIGSEWSHSAIALGADNSTISHNTIQKTNNLAIGIEFSGNNMTVEYNHLENISGNGIDTSYGHNNIVRNNYIHCNRRGIRWDVWGSDNQILNNIITKSPESAIAIYEFNDRFLIAGNTVYQGNIRISGGNDTIVENNYFYNGSWCEAVGQTHEPWGYSPVTNFTFRNNFMRNSPYLVLGVKSNATIENNIFINSPSHAIITGFYHGEEPPEEWFGNYTIKNNVFYSMPNDAIHIENYRRDIDIKNNIFLNVSGKCVYSPRSENVSVSYNAIWNCNSPYFYGVTGTNTLEEDPLFADVLSDDFHLKSQYGRWNGTDWVYDNETSPCVDAGDPNSSYSNETYPHGQRINIGAYGNTSEASKSPYHKIYLSVPMTIYSNGEYSYPEPPITYKDNQTVNITFNVSDTTNLTINSYTSSQIGFTATNTTTDQKMNITVFNGTFKVVNGKKYEIKKDGVVQQTKTASDNKVVFTDIPVGSDYVITESGDNGYTITLSQGYNMIGWTSTTPTNSSNLCNEVPNCSYVYKKNPDGSWTAKQCGYPGGEFTVSRGFGFLAYVTEACEWTRDE